MKKALPLLLAVLLTFIASLLIKSFLLSDYSDSVYYPTVWALIWAGVAFWVAEDLSNQSIGKFAVYILAGVIGAAAGWLLGICFFPRSIDEAARFQSIGTVIGTFLTGYLLKDFGDLWKYLVSPGAGSTSPPIFLSPRKEYLAFFFASFLISGGVQYGARTIQHVNVGWNGPTPKTDSKDTSRFIIPAGFRSQLSGSVDSGDNPALRWSVESPSNPETLKKAKAHSLIVLDAETGILTVAEKGSWSWQEKDAQGSAVKQEIRDGFNAQIIGTSVSTPQMARAIDVKFDPAQPIETSGSNAPTGATGTAASSSSGGASQSTGASGTPGSGGSSQRVPTTTTSSAEHKTK